MNEYDRALGPAETAATKDGNIDFSDIAELDEHSGSRRSWSNRIVPSKSPCA